MNMINPKRPQMKLILYAASFILILFVFITGCSTTPVCISPSTVPVDPEAELEMLGPVKGSDRAYSVLGLYEIGYPDIDRAMKRALEEKGGDALINIKMYERFYYFILFSYTEVVLEGEAVKIHMNKDSHSIKKGKR